VNAEVGEICEIMNQQNLELCQNTINAVLVLIAEVMNMLLKYQNKKSELCILTGHLYWGKEEGLKENLQNYKVVVGHAICYSYHREFL